MYVCMLKGNIRTATVCTLAFYLLSQTLYLHFGSLENAVSIFGNSNRPFSSSLYVASEQRADPVTQRHFIGII